MYFFNLNIQNLIEHLLILKCIYKTILDQKFKLNINQEDLLVDGAVDGAELGESEEEESGTGDEFYAVEDSDLDGVSDREQCSYEYDRGNIISL